ncbi:unnamed protein product [Cuscuta campestris]|uniref:protein-disulfide reductase n=1 Tax=Cuscuta campestris TaxID=132261 RepID=A0A484LTA0_9ASTE|nr:unnamed protein product [Cuscuta campestris]
MNFAQDAVVSTFQQAHMSLVVTKLNTWVINKDLIVDFVEIVDGREIVIGFEVMREHIGQAGFNLAALENNIDNEHERQVLPGAGTSCTLMGIEDETLWNVFVSKAKNFGLLEIYISAEQSGAGTSTSRPPEDVMRRRRVSIAQRVEAIDNPESDSDSEDSNSDGVETKLRWIEETRREAESGRKRYTPDVAVQENMLFPSFESLEVAITKDCIKDLKVWTLEYKRERSMACRCWYHDGNPRCYWRAQTAKGKKSDHWLLKNYHQRHTCRPDYSHGGDDRNITSQFIARMLFRKLRVDPEYKVKLIRHVVTELYKVPVSYKKCWLARLIASETLCGSWKNSYKQVPILLQALVSSYPGTVVDFVCTSPPTDLNTEPVIGVNFKYAFWAFPAAINGLQHCLPVVTVDGTHLYGKYKGHLLLIVALNGNHKIFPLAYAVVDGESVFLLIYLLHRLFIRLLRPEVEEAAPAAAAPPADAAPPSDAAPPAAVAPPAVPAAPLCAVCLSDGIVTTRDHFRSALFKRPEESGVPDKSSAETPVYPIRLGSDLRETMCKTVVSIRLSLTLKPLLRFQSNSSLMADLKGDADDLQSLLSSPDRDFLIRNNGDRVKIEDLKGKKVGLYFSASWCGPCRHFTPKLTEVYNEILPKGDFEIVFVSADVDDNSFDGYFSKMPWTAIPFSDSATRDRLNGLFTVSGIPHLVILDENGKVSTKDGVEIIFDYGVEGYPFTAERIKELKEAQEAAIRNQSLQSILVTPSRDFVIAADGKKVPVNDLEGKTVGLYFSLSTFHHYSEFTPMLLEVYQKLKERKENFEIVTIPLESNENAFKEAFKSLPWFSIPFGDQSRDKLVRYFEVFAPPTLVIIGPNGKTLQSNVAEAIEEHGILAYPFTAERLAELEEMAKAKKDAQTLESILVKGESDFVIGKDGAKVPVSDLVGKTILLYFSAHWCPPCREFLPKLIDAYGAIKAEDDAFEVVFISSDRDQASFDEYFSQMPWLALPFGDDERKGSLSRLFRVRGIPTLVAVGKSGRTLTTEAVEMVANFGADAYPFTEERLNELVGHESASEDEEESRKELWVCSDIVCKRA